MYDNWLRLVSSTELKLVVNKSQQNVSKIIFKFTWIHTSHASGSAVHLRIKVF